MDEKMDKFDAKMVISPCEAEALKKCLEENNGDYLKCQSQVEAFRASRSVVHLNSPLKPLRLSFLSYVVKELIFEN